MLLQIGHTSTAATTTEAEERNNFLSSIRVPRMSSLQDEELPIRCECCSPEAMCGGGGRDGVLGSRFLGRIVNPPTRKKHNIVLRPLILNTISFFYLLCL